MEKVKVLIKYPTGSITRKGELTLSTGVVEFDPNTQGEVEYAHLSSLGARNYDVVKVEAEAPASPEPAVEDYAEEAKEQEAEIVETEAPASPERKTRNKRRK